MNYFITGGTGFIGTHLTNLLQELHPECNVYNLDIVEPGTPLPSVEDYKPALRKGQKLASTFIRCDVRKPIVLEVRVKRTLGVLPPAAWAAPCPCYQLGVGCFSVSHVIFPSS